MRMIFKKVILLKNFTIEQRLLLSMHLVSVLDAPSDFSIHSIPGSQVGWRSERAYFLFISYPHYQNGVALVIPNFLCNHSDSEP